MAMMQLTAMPRDLLPVTTAPTRGGDPASGASETDGFRRLLQERQSVADSQLQESGKKETSKNGGALSPASAASRRPAEDVQKTARKGAETACGSETAAAEADEADAPASAAQADKGGLVGTEKADSSLDGSSKAEEVVTNSDASDEAKDEAAAASVAGNTALASAEVLLQMAMALDSDEKAAAAPEETPGDASPTAVPGVETVVAGASAGETDSAVTMVNAELKRAVPEMSATQLNAAQETLQHDTAAASSGAGNSTSLVSGVPSRTETKGVMTGQREGLPLRQTTGREKGAAEDDATARLEAASALAAADGEGTDPASAATLEQQSQEAKSADAAERAQQAQKQNSGVSQPAPVTAQEEPSPPGSVQKQPEVVDGKEAPLKPHSSTLQVGANEHRRQAVASQAQEQREVLSKVTVHQDGNTVSAADAVQAVTQQEGPEQIAAGGAGKGDHEQKETGKEAGHLQASAFGAEVRTTEAASRTGTPAAQRDALHQSILSQVKDGVASFDGKGNGHVTISLHPDELGQLKIQVRMEDGRVRVDVQAENRTVKDLLMSNVDSLKEALAGKTLTMDGFEVFTGGGSHNPMPDQRANSPLQVLPHLRRSGYPDSDRSGGRVNYLTAEVNNLLDVRF